MEPKKSGVSSEERAEGLAAVTRKAHGIANQYTLEGDQRTNLVRLARQLFGDGSDEEHEATKSAVFADTSPNMRGALGELIEWNEEVRERGKSS